MHNFAVFFIDPKIVQDLALSEKMRFWPETRVVQSADVALVLKNEHLKIEIRTEKKRTGFSPSPLLI